MVAAPKVPKATYGKQGTSSKSAQGRIPMAAPKGTYGKQAWSLATDNIFSAVPLPAPKPTAARRRRITVEIEEDMMGD